MSWFADHAAMIASSGSLLSIGAIGMRVSDRWLVHKREARRQSDTVALDLVEQLRGEMAINKAQAQAEHVRCEANLSMERHDRHNLETMVVSLLRGFKFVPAERLAEFVTDIERDWLLRRPARADIDPGNIRQDAQIARSAANLARDNLAEAQVEPAMGE